MKNYLKIFVIGTMLHGVQTYGITVRFRTSVKEESYKTYELGEFNLNKTVGELKDYVVENHIKTTEKNFYTLQNYQCVFFSKEKNHYIVLKPGETLVKHGVENDSKLVINSLENVNEQSCYYNIFAKPLTANSIKIDGVSLNSTVGNLRTKVAETKDVNIPKKENVKLVYSGTELRDDNVFLSDIFALWNGINEQITVHVLLRFDSNLIKEEIVDTNENNKNENEIHSAEDLNSFVENENLFDENGIPFEKGKKKSGKKTDKKKWWGWCPC